MFITQDKIYDQVANWKQNYVLNTAEKFNNFYTSKEMKKNQFGDSIIQQSSFEDKN